MTMPHERTRALLWAGEILRDTLSGKLSLDEVKQQAARTLRHYPNAQTIDYVAQMMERGEAHAVLPNPLLSRVDKNGNAIDSFKPAQLAQSSSRTTTSVTTPDITIALKKLHELQLSDGDLGAEYWLSISNFLKKAVDFENRALSAEGKI